MAANRRNARRRAAPVVTAPEPRALALAGGLLATVLFSALTVVHASHTCRQLYAQLQSLEADQWYLQEDYSRLLLEQSTWASHYRVEKVAEDELGMQPPVMAELRVVTP